MKTRKTLGVMLVLAAAVFVVGLIQFTAPAVAGPPYCSLMCDTPSSGSCTAECNGHPVITTCAVYLQGPCCYCPTPPGQESCC